MKRLIYVGVPLPHERLKDARPDSVPIGGAQVAESELVSALLRYSTFDAFEFLWPDSGSLATVRERLACYPGHHRARVITPERLDPAPGETIVLQGNPLLYQAASIRSQWGHPAWPVAGITHALSIADGLVSALFSLTTAVDALRPYDCLICTSTAAQKAFTALRNTSAECLPDPLRQMIGTFRTSLIPLGVDTERYVPGDRPAAKAASGWSPSDIVVLCLGRLSPEYKLDPLPTLVAFASAFRSRRDVRLVFAGDTTAAGRCGLDDAAAALGIGEQCELRTNPSSVEKLTLMQAADVFITLSDNLQETFGLTILEAMSCGLPVIASDWSGYRDTVVPAQTGFLAPTTWWDVGNYLSRVTLIGAESWIHRRMSQQVTVDVQAVIQALLALVNQPSLRTEMGKSGRARALAVFDWRHIIGRYDALFFELIAEGSRRSSSGAMRPSHIPGSYDHRLVFGHYANTVIPLPIALRRGVIPVWVPKDATLIAACELFHNALHSSGGTIKTRSALEQIDIVTQDRQESIRILQLMLKYGHLQAV